MQTPAVLHLFMLYLNSSTKTFYFVQERLQSKVNSLQQENDAHILDIEALQSQSKRKDALTKVCFFNLNKDLWHMIFCAEILRKCIANNVLNMMGFITGKPLNITGVYTCLVRSTSYSTLPTKKSKFKFNKLKMI